MNGDPTSSGGADERPVPTLLLLADGDDVFIATRAVVPGQQRTSRGDVVEVIEPIELGHKVAARAIASGQRIVRCGMPIGSAIVDIEAGEWVHTHNLASDYIVTFAHRGAVQ